MRADENTAIETIKADLEYAIQKEKETEYTEDTLIWHMVVNDYKIAIKALEEIQEYRAIGKIEECRDAMKKQKERK